jgi:hypothetical protein
MRIFINHLAAMLLAQLVWACPVQAAPFTEAQNQILSEGMTFWGVTSVHDCPEGISGEVEPPGTFGGESAEGKTIVGEAFEVNCEMKIIEGLEPCVEREIIYHELGHLLGYGHSTDPGSIMYPVLQRRFCPPPEPEIGPYREPKHHPRKFQHRRTLRVR